MLKVSSRDGAKESSYNQARRPVDHERWTFAALVTGTLQRRPDTYGMALSHTRVPSEMQAWGVGLHGRLWRSNGTDLPLLVE